MLSQKAKKGGQFYTPRSVVELLVEMLEPYQGRVFDPCCGITPGRYVGLAEEEDDFDFAERFTGFKAEFEAQLKEESELNERIMENLNKIQLPNG